MKIWLIIYAASLVLLPPLRLGGKSFYAAELMLIPVFILFALRLIQGKIQKPPKELIAVVVALSCAFFMGMSRDNSAATLAKYWTFTDDTFNWVKDLTRYFRFLMIFSLPYIITQTFQKPPTFKPSELFIKVLKYSLVISVCIALLEKCGFVMLREYYHPDAFPHFWAGRSYATFSSPLEASMMFMALTVQTIGSFRKNSRRWMEDFFVILILFLGFYMAQGGTALVGGIVAIAYLVMRNLSLKKRGAILVGFAVAVGLFIYLLPPQLVADKLGNILYRTQIWTGWLKSLPQRPLSALAGMGFTNLPVDNSLLLLVMIGGLLLLAAALFWFGKLYKIIPSWTYPFFIVWVVSWLALDTIAYWGIGRSAWLLLGLLALENKETFDRAE